MATNFTINGSVTLDESTGLQTGGIAATGEDNNDQDILPSGLSSAFLTRIAFYGLDAASALGAAQSASNFISLTSSDAVIGLGFVDGSGSGIPILGSLSGVLTDLQALDGGAISLFSDPVLGNRLVWGVDANGDKVFALFLEPASNLSSARVQMIQFEALHNPNAFSPDDAINLDDFLGVSASVNQSFSFAGLPSGQNLFGMVGDSASGLVVYGANAKFSPATGLMMQGSDTINTSQGGGSTTIGVNNQMFDQGDGAFFTFVKSPSPNYTGTALDSNEADDADLINFGSLLEGKSAFLRVSQTQGNETTSLKLTAYNIVGDPQGQALFTAAKSVVEIKTVEVRDSTGKLLGTADGVSVDISSGVATVSGLKAGHKITWTADSVFDQVRVDGNTGKFDIGGFGLEQSFSASVDIGAQVRFEDDGPSVTLTLKEGAQVLVDESSDANVGEDPTIGLGKVIVAGDDLFNTSAAYGADGQGATASVYSLKVTDGVDSGLKDTLTGTAVRLYADGPDVVGKNDYGDEVLRISIDPDDGSVGLALSRSLMHGNSEDADESAQPLSIVAGAIEAVRTVADGDNDPAIAKVDLGPALKFEDDGPDASMALQDNVEIRIDESSDTNAGENENFGLGRVTVAGTVLFTAGSAPGNDGPGTTGSGYSLKIASEGVLSGLTDSATKTAVKLYKDGPDVVGRDENGNGVLRISIDPTSGDVTVTLERALEHSNVDDPDEAGSPLSIASGVVSAVYTVTDGDTDHDSANADLGPIIMFEDDGPSLGPISDALVDFAAGASVTKTLDGAVGADMSASPYILTDFTQSITVNGVELRGVIAGDSTSVTYFANTDGDGAYGSAGDVAYYTLSLDQTGAGSYTFDVLVDPPASTQPFSFNGLPSGQNLFGMVGESSAGGLIVYGRDPKFSAATGLMQQGSNTINTSKGGGDTTIGINNQMFDKGEGAYFTFVKNPAAALTGIALDGNEADDIDNLQYSSLLEVKTGFLEISQTQGNEINSLTIKAYDVAGDTNPQGSALVTAAKASVDIAAIRVFDADGNPVNLTVNIDGGVAIVSGLKAGYRVEWDTSANHDQVLVEATSGKFDIGGFGTMQGNDTLDQLLHFTATITDADGDFWTDDWFVGIDGTGANDDGVVAGATPMPEALSMAAFTDISNQDLLGNLSPTYIIHPDMWI